MARDVEGSSLESMLRTATDLWNDNQPTPEILRRFKAICVVLQGRNQLVFDLLFDRYYPRLVTNPEDVRHEARRYERSTELLVRVALDFWCDSGDVRLQELVEVLTDAELALVFEGLRTLKTPDAVEKRSPSKK